jgi:preprotein translocase SecE subunit
MARNRQRAKERQARRQAQQAGGGGDQARPKPEASKQPPLPAEGAPEEAAPPLSESERMRVGAPPEDVGSSSEVLEFEQALDAEDGEHFDSAEDIPEEDLEHGGRAAAAREKHRDRPRLVQFLVAVWAELQRVQWPNREALTTLTGVVLGFVLIAGGYLGLLDAIFSRVIQAVL